jgi:hypothetical protein
VPATEQSKHWADIDWGMWIVGLGVFAPFLVILLVVGSQFLSLGIEHPFAVGIPLSLIVVWLWIWFRESSKQEQREEKSVRQRANELRQLSDRQAGEIIALQQKITDLQDELAQQRTLKQQPLRTVHNAELTPVERKLLVLALDQGATSGEWAVAGHKLFTALRNRRVNGYTFLAAAQ